jgi:hypothetical protein
MPTRHLSDEQRQRYANFAAAPSPEQLARYFHLDRSDREITDGHRQLVVDGMAKGATGRVTAVDRRDYAAIATPVTSAHRANAS